MLLIRNVAKSLFLVLALLGPAGASHVENPRAFEVRSQLIWYHSTFRTIGSAAEASGHLFTGAVSASSVLAQHISVEFKKPLSVSLNIVKQAYAQSLLQGLPLPLVLGVIEKESGFNVRASNSYGAKGLMQVVPRFHPDKLEGLDPSSLLTASVNLMAGTKVLKEYLDGASGNLALALRKYSGGSREYATTVERYSQKYAHLTKVAQVAKRLSEYAIAGAMAPQSGVWRAGLLSMPVENG
jgi:soluble lytic murein transglycosylase-like protein